MGARIKSECATRPLRSARGRVISRAAACVPLSESTATPSGQVAVRETQLPGVPVSPSLGPAKTTIAIPARSDLAAPAFAMATNGPDAGRKTVQRCFVEHLRANLERHPETALEVDLPSTLVPHFCCDLETIGTTTPTDLMPLHPNVHDPRGEDGVALREGK